MTGILNKFHVEHGVQGARVLARSFQLSAPCKTETEIDFNIQMLKDDLEHCAREMKRLVKINSAGSLFQGWPPATDDDPGT